MIAGGVTLSVLVSPVVAAVTVGQCLHFIDVSLFDFASFRNFFGSSQDFTFIPELFLIGFARAFTKE